MFNNFFSEKKFVNEIMRKNIFEPDRTHDTMAHAHCILGT